MRFASLGSGSRGNATLVEHQGTHVLVDCGFSVASVVQRLARLDCTLEQISAIVVTHEHSDHIRGVGVLARRGGMPVYMTPGTAAQNRDQAIPQLELFNCHRSFKVGALEIQPFPVPHDAREPSQFVFSDGRSRLGILTDVGHVTPHITAMLDGCDALLLECNHDQTLLQQGSYPAKLKQRVGGHHGHLNNSQAAGLLEQLDCSRLQHLVAAHLSEQNNTPAHARAALSRVLGCEPDWIGVCDQDEGLFWRAIN